MQKCTTEKRKNKLWTTQKVFLRKADHKLINRRSISAALPWDTDTWGWAKVWPCGASGGLRSTKRGGKTTIVLSCSDQLQAAWRTWPPGRKSDRIWHVMSNQLKLKQGWSQRVPPCSLLPSAQFPPLMSTFSCPLYILHNPCCLPGPFVWEVSEWDHWLVPPRDGQVELVKTVGDSQPLSAQAHISHWCGRLNTALPI